MIRRRRRAICASPAPSGSTASTSSIARQLIFDDAGNILTDARYSRLAEPTTTSPFPKHIEINRPRDEYGVVIDVVKMDINKGVSDDKFVLDQPRRQPRCRFSGSPPVPPEPPRQKDHLK